MPRPRLVACAPLLILPPFAELIGAAATATLIGATATAAPEPPAWIPSEGPNALLGDAQGLFPGRVAQKDVVVYDASVGWNTRALPDRIYVPLHAEFPAVRWVAGPGRDQLRGPRLPPSRIPGRARLQRSQAIPQRLREKLRQLPPRGRARGTHAKLGPYKPNGVPCGSLRNHEHWNNATDKQYSRNLTPDGRGIELLRVK